MSKPIIRTRTDYNANYHAIFANGETLRFYIDENKPMLAPRYPELYDVSINNKCHGGCSYCYASAKRSGKNYEDIVEKAYEFFGPLGNDAPFQIACLEENTLISTPNNGMVKVGSLNVGDSVFNESNGVSKIKEVVRSEKSAIRLIGNKGFNVVCTPDHVFIDEFRNEIEAKDLLGKRLLVSKNGISVNEYPTIDLADFVKSPSRTKGVRGGAGGGSVTDSKVRLMHTSPFINRYIIVDEDLMWLYGLVTAEGYSRGISLHKDEIDIANRAIKIYNKVSGNSGASTRPNGENGIAVEFHNPLIFRTIFFDAMGQEYGAKNKNFSYCFSLNNTSLIASAIIGVFDGDGCYRNSIDKRYGSMSYSARLKVASEKLVHDVNTLLRVRLNIDSGCGSTTTKERQIEGRTLRGAEHFYVSIYKNRDLAKLFPERFDESLYTFTYNKKSLNAFQDYIEIKEIRDEGVCTVCDITLEDGTSHLFTIEHGVVVHNCGGAGEPTEHPDFVPFMEAIRSMNIMPNYTTNGMNINDDIIECAVNTCGGVAVSAHLHLEGIWRHTIRMYHDAGALTNMHIVIGAPGSFDDMLRLYAEYNDCVKHFVLLPYIPQGRAKELPGIQDEWDTLFEWLAERDNINRFAFGAYFFNQIEKFHIPAYTYEPHMFSSYLDMDKMKIYESSFHGTVQNDS